MSGNFVNEIERAEQIQLLIDSGYEKEIHLLLTNETKWTTKKHRLNKSGACRVLGKKPKELEQMIQEWREILGVDLFD
jgi:hypothetical protein